MNEDKYNAAIKADNDYQKELEAVYGNKAGDARYDSRGAATPKLAALRDAKLKADDELHADWNRRVARS